MVDLKKKSRYGKRSKPALLTLRAFRVLSYYMRRILCTAYPEPELTFIQKLRSSFILPGTPVVGAPKGYFARRRKKLCVKDDVAGLPSVLWEDHPQTQVPPPRKASVCPPVKCRWHTPSASFILNIPDGYVAPDGLVYNNRSVYRNAKWYYESPPNSLPTIHVDRLITFIQYWTTSFIHFTFDTLPRLNLAYDLLCNEPDIKILVPDRPFIPEVFNKLEIDPGRIIFQKSGYVYSADMVYYPHFYNHGLPKKMGLIPLGSLDKVRAKLSGPDHQHQDQLVYLKRKQGFSRNVSNENDFLNEIRKRIKKGLGLTVFEPCGNWKKDKEVIKRARVVFGPHGGAWSNIIFCKKNTDVIEFIPLVSLKERGLNERPCYYGLASALNLNYWCIEPENFEFDKPRKKMKVSEDELLTVLEEIGVLG